MREINLGDATPVTKLTGGARGTVSFLFGPILTACIAGGTIIWTLARQPDRSDFQETQKEVTQIRLDMAAMKGDLAGVSKGSADAERRNEDQFKELKALIKEGRHR